MLRFVFLIFTLFSLINVYSDENLLFVEKSIIENSINDGFYTFAEEKCRNIIPNLSNKEKKDYQFLLIHSIYAQGKYDQALELILKMEESGSSVYWKAKILKSLGRESDAFDILEEMKSDNELAPERMFLKSLLLYDLKEYEESIENLLKFKNIYPNHKKNLEVDYQLALNYLALKKIDKVELIVQKIVTLQSQEISNQAKIILASILLDYRKDMIESKRLLEEIYNSEIAQVDHKLISLKMLVNLHIKNNDFSSAISHLENSINWLPSNNRFKIKKKLIDLYLEKKMYDEALKWIDAARAEEISHAEAISLQFNKSEILVKLDRFNDAVFSYQILLDVVDEPHQVSLAYYGRGTALWNLNRFNESANMFQRSASIAIDNKLKNQSLLKAGDSYYESAQYSKSEEYYRRFLEENPSHQFRAQALYQLGLAVARIGRRSEASTIFQSVYIDYPNSDFSIQAMLRLSDIFIADQKWDDAIDMYFQIENISSETNDIILSKKQRGLLLYNLGNYAEAKKTFEEIIFNYEDSDIALQANYLRGFCLYMLNEVEEALNICNTFVDKYPNSVWTPDVLFWLGEQSYNSGNFNTSEKFFVKIHSIHNKHRLAEQSLFMVGKSLIKQKKYTEALENFSLFVRTYPSSFLLADVRFYQGDILSELGEYARAILAFEEIIKKFPEHDLVNISIGRIGDCQFSLAANQESRYDEALSKFNTLIQKKTLSDDLLLQCLYKSGRCESKKGNLDNAFDYYLSAVYHFFDNQVLKTSPNIMWFTRSAFAAAELQGDLGNVNGAIAIYERVVSAEVNSSEEAIRRIDILKSNKKLKNER